MTVDELISILKQEPKDKKVCVSKSEFEVDGYYFKKKFLEIEQVRTKLDGTVYFITEDS